MTIRSKLAFVLGVSMLLFIALIQVFGRRVMKEQVRVQEESTVRADIKRVITLFEEEENGFVAFTESESFRADAAEILDPARNRSLDSHKVASVFLINQCDIIACADPSGRVLQARMFDRKSGGERAVPTDFQARLDMIKPLRETLSPAEDFSVILAFEKIPHLVVVHPSLKHPPNAFGDGLLIVARKIDGTFMEQLGRIANLPLRRLPTMKIGLPDGVKAALDAGTNRFTTAVRAVSEDTISGLVQVRDPGGAPALVMSFDAPRLLNALFNRSWTLFAGVFVGAVLLMMILSAVVIDKMVVARLSRLAAVVKTIDSDTDRPGPVPVEGGDEISGLAVSINGMLESLHDYNEERRDLIQRLESDSLEDPLTGLYNRRGFLTIGREYLNLSARNKTRMHLLFLDMDNLKQINDTFGHATGDEAIVRAAEIIKSVFRSSDVKSRLGGDEFAVFPIASSIQGLKSSLGRFHEKISEFNRSGICPFTLSFSSGVAGYDPENPSTIEDLLARADKRMYEEKRRKTENDDRA